MKKNCGKKGCITNKQEQKNKLIKGGDHPLLLSTSFFVVARSAPARGLFFSVASLSVKGASGHLRSAFCLAAARVLGINLTILRHIVHLAVIIPGLREFMS